MKCIAREYIAISTNVLECVLAAAAWHCCKTSERRFRASHFLELSWWEAEICKPAGSKGC